MILHDWSDEYALRILTQLRAVAGAKTQLLVVDNTISYACPDTTAGDSIPGASMASPPYPLLANMGAANAQPYGVDIHVNVHVIISRPCTDTPYQMLAFLNGIERTVAEFDELFKRSGWKLERVFHSAGFEIENAKLVAVPF